MLHDEMGHHLEVLHNSLNQYFLNDQCMTFQSYSWVEDPFKVHERPLIFNVMEQGGLTASFRFHIANNLTSYY